MRQQSRVVVIGGGIAGCSLLYHLTRLGWTDATLVERGELTSGSTWHAAGLCTQYHSSLQLTRLLMRSIELYRSLEAETGQRVDFHQVGSIRLASVPDRLDEYRHAEARARILGLPFELLGRAEVGRLWPLASLDGILGAAYTPTDGYVDPSSVTQALARGARERGATILRRTRVLAIEPRRSGEWDVVTDAGTITAEIVVNAAGQWAPEIARMTGTDLPIVPLEHQYVVTEPIGALVSLEHELPVLRDPERSFYIRQEAGGLLCGPFEPNPLPWAIDGIPPDFGQQLLAPNLPQIEGVLAAAAERVPLFGEAGIRRVVNGPDGYTPDGRALLGPVPGLRNVHVLAGFSIFGIVFGGGAGACAAEWIVEGKPSIDLWEADVRRFGPHAAATDYLVARARDVYEHEYAIHYPHEDRPAGRPLKQSAIHDRLTSKGAVFGARNGWERPLWFAPPGVEPVDRLTFRRPNWLEPVAAECRGVRERAGLLDQASFAKYEVRGPGATAFLDRLAANALPVADGRIVLSQFLDRSGGIECDLTITRLAPDHYYLVGAAATETHDLDWLERHSPDDGSVTIENVTPRFGVLTLAGPRSRDILARWTRADLSTAAFPFLRARRIEVAGVPVLALRISYVGELGWELHYPTEYGRRLYDALVAAGEPEGIVDFGYRALESLRLEKGYRLWGADITPDYTPLEAGLERFVRFDKGDFIGRDALLAQRERGLERTLACLTIELGDAIPFGNEPVHAGAQIVGYLLAAAVGHTVGATIGLAYLPPSLAAPGTALEVEILGERQRAAVVPAPLYDPQNRKLRG